MRRLLAASVAALAAACVVVDPPQQQQPSGPPPGPTAQPGPTYPGAGPSSEPGPAREPAASSRIGQQHATALAFGYARDRGLEVDQVHAITLQASGRWRIDLTGPSGDRALMLLDASDGRLLKGRFRSHGEAAAGAPPAEGARDPLDEQAPPSSPGAPASP
jgi:hypothetical protein